MPNEYETNQAEWPIFAKVDGRILPWMSLKGALILGAACLLAFALNHAAAGWTREAEADRSAADIAADVDEMKLARTVVALDEVTSELEALSGALGEPKDGLSEEELERFYELTATSTLLRKDTAVMLSSELASARKLAADRGITPSTADSELEALAPKTEMREVRVIPQPVALLLVAFIVVTTAVFVLEPEEGSNLAGRFAEMRTFRRKQHEYLYSRLTGSFSE